MTELQSLTRNTLTNERQIGYRKHLQTILGQSDDFSVFIELIGEILSRFGIKSWAYSVIDLPGYQMAIRQLGNLHPEVIDVYAEQGYYRFDLALQHIKNAREPIFQSSVITEIKKINLVTDLTNDYKKIADMNRGFGYEDTLNIPVASSIDGSLISLSLTSHGMYAKNFHASLKSKIPDLHTVALAINDIGMTHHRRQFRGPVIDCKSKITSRPIELISLMGKHDLNVNGLVEKTGLKKNTINNHLKSIRGSLGVSTNIGAYEKARQLGYIQ
jgi:Autoinducer binding domain